MCDGMAVAVGGGVESVSLVQNKHANTHRTGDPDLREQLPALYMPMLHTAEVLAERYGVSRDRQDALGLESQRRASTAQSSGILDEELAPLAFAVQSLACVDAWGIDPEIVNSHGGAIALGHPLGASGGRVLGTLAKRLTESGGRYGVAAICIGVGQGLAVVLENVGAGS
jgi:acetyl-CoA acetyltransferase